MSLKKKYSLMSTRVLGIWLDHVTVEPRKFSVLVSESRSYLDTSKSYFVTSISSLNQNKRKANPPNLIYTVNQGSKGDLNKHTWTQSEE